VATEKCLEGIEIIRLHQANELGVGAAGQVGGLWPNRLLVRV
jgi:hypothetical protein